MPDARISASEIGTSIPNRPARKDAHADRKNGWPEKATVGRAMTAEIRWNMSRVAAVAPDQTATDSSMMFIIAKNAMPRRINRSRDWRSFSVPDRATISSGSASNPSRANWAIIASGVTPGSWRTRTRFRVRLTRASVTPAMAFKPCSTV